MQTPAYRTKLSDVFSSTLMNGPIPYATLPHIHDAYEIMLILSEGVSCRIGHEKLPVPCGSVLLFNSADLHGLSTENNASCTRYVTYFQPELIARLSTAHTQLLECFYYRPTAHPQLLPLSEPQCAQLRQLLDQLICIARQSSDSYGHDLRIQLCLAELLICLNQFYRAHHRISGQPLALTPLYDMLSYIHQHLAEKITLSSLSEHFFIPARELSRLFHSTLGLSLGDYLIKCRIARATDALKQGLRVEEVCEQVGFQNLSHFSRTFKQFTGLSPKQYAKQHERVLKGES